MGCRARGAGLAVEKRQAAAGDSVPVVRAPPSRDRGGTHPGRVLRVWNVAIPSGPPASAGGRPTVRKVQLRGGDRTTREAKAGASKGDRKPGQYGSAFPSRRG